MLPFNPAASTLVFLQMLVACSSHPSQVYSRLGGTISWRHQYFEIMLILNTGSSWLLLLPEGRDFCVQTTFQPHPGPASSSLFSARTPLPALHLLSLLICTPLPPAPHLLSQVAPLPPAATLVYLFLVLVLACSIDMHMVYQCAVSVHSLFNSLQTIAAALRYLLLHVMRTAYMDTSGMRCWPRSSSGIL